ncbi:hypothetical protein [Hydrogenophaga sp. 2FB]|uniref:hypothetical protein n=1 Tax=Hydrogenophaga sp. 2FB TaxID=2502187 RepID=UPI0010F54486|nr:hypothetical protein [Hydrogenophaga sp. 2FB]
MDLEHRKLAREQQVQVEADRLRRHADLAAALLSASPDVRDAVIGEAKARVNRWREKLLCSEDFITRWDVILALPVERLAEEIVSDCDGWGRALRQNTPFTLNGGPAAGLALT